MELVQLKFLKQILKVRKSTPTCMVYRECNKLPLYITRMFRILNYWLKLIKLDVNDPLRILYDTSIMLNQNNTFINNTSCCWALNVKQMLYKNGFGYIWENQHMGVDKGFINIFKRRLTDSFWQDNKAEIDGLSRNRLYRHLDIENIFYLSVLPNNFIRTALTKLRLGSHHLMIERGRWSNIIFEDRKCLLYDELEDEFHFVVTCVKYHDLRVKYLPKALYIKPSMLKFIDFLTLDY